MSVESHRPPVRVAIMGLGRSVFENHYPVFKRHPQLFSVVAACDTMRERRDIIAKDFPACRMFRRFDDMLDEKDVDLVDIASCTTDHAKHALASLDRGRWTLVETPLATTPDECQVLRGAAAKAKNRLLVLQRGMFSPDFLLAKAAMSDPRLGEIHMIKMRREDFVRRDDWQTVKRLGGGAAYYAMTDLLMQVLKLMPLPPLQMWSDLKRIASMGDAEDYVRVAFKTRGKISAEIEFNGGALAPCRGPSFTICGERGEFSVMPGADEGVLRVIDPSFRFPRRRSSVRTPPIKDMHETVPVQEIPVRLPKGTMHGPSAFWRHVYETVRTAAPFPLALEDSIEAVRLAHLMKKTSVFGK